jgi:hypothetical protein
VLIIPMDAVWLLATMPTLAVTGPGGAPGAVDRLIWIGRLIAGFAPRAPVDDVAARWPRARDHRDA